jgi:hypothetical protein
VTHSELENLNYLALRAHQLIREGDPAGVSGLRTLEKQLAAALDDTAPSHHASAEYHQGVETLYSLRKAIGWEELLEGVPIYDQMTKM